MQGWQQGDELAVFTPLVTCVQILTTLWGRASEESEQPVALFEDWMQEVSDWAGLVGWQASLKEKLHYGENLWLPGMKEQELALLLGIFTLANALGCSPIHLAQALLRLPYFSSGQLAQLQQERVTHSHQEETVSMSAPTIQEQDERHTGPVFGKAVDYHPLIEALTNWQAMFELALDEAATHLDQELLPMQDLQTSLSEMCDLLRDVLLKISSSAQTGKETI